MSNLYLDGMNENLFVKHKKKPPVRVTFKVSKKGLWKIGLYAILFRMNLRKSITW